MIRLAKRLLRLGTLGVLAVLLTLSAALLWLTGTQQGLHFLLRQAAPYGVTVQQATGRLLWGVDLQGMQLDLGNTTVAAGHLRLRWRPWQFPVLGTLAVDSLVAEDLTIETMPTPPSPQNPFPAWCCRYQSPFITWKHNASAIGKPARSSMGRSASGLPPTPPAAP